MATATDDFNRADGALGANWTTAHNGGGQIISNQYAPVTNYTREAAFYSGTSFGANQYSQAKRTSFGEYAGIAVRVSVGGNYYAWMHNGQLLKFVSGTPTTLATVPTFSVGPTLRLEIVGDTLEGFSNGVSQFTYTDSSSPLTTGQPGLATYSQADGCKIDDWAGGDIAPTLTSVSPGAGAPSTTVSVTLTGRGFVSGATVAVTGTGITVSSVVVVSATSITADLAITSAAAVGVRTVTVTTPGGTSAGRPFTVTGATATDTFNRADGAPGANWTLFANGGMLIAGNGVVPSGLSEAGHFWSAAAFSADQTSQVTRTTTGNYGGPAVRCAWGGTIYAATCIYWLNNGIVRRMIAGGVTTLTSSAPTFASGDVATLAIVGTTLTFYVNGVQVGTLVDSGAPAGGAPGIIFYNNIDTPGVKLDDFIATDLAPVPVPAPTLTSITPDEGNRGTSLGVTLTGTNFVVGATVAVSGTGIAATEVVVVSPTSITATFTVEFDATVGAHAVTVTTPDGTSGPVGFTVIGPPVLTGISPAAGTPGTAVAVTLTGANFVVAGTTVAVSGTGITVTGVAVADESTLSALFTLDAGATLGPRAVTVTTADGTSGPVTFTVLTVVAVPTLTGITPDEGALGTTVAVTLTGTNFVVGSTSVAVSGAGVTVTVTSVVVTSATTLTAEFVIDASSAALGAHSVTVTTGSGTSNAVTFTVVPFTAAPTLWGIAPNAGTQGTSVAVTVTGTGFVAGATTLAVSGTGVTVAALFVSEATALSATLVIAVGATLGARTVTVTTPEGTSGPLPFTVLVSPTGPEQPPPGVHNMLQARSAVCLSGVVGSSNTTRHLHVWLHGSHNLDVTCHLMDTTGLSITKSLSGGLGQFTFAIRHLVPTIATPVTVDLGLVLIWGGNVITRSSSFLDDLALVHHDVGAVEWRWLLDRWRLVSGTYTNIGVNVLVAKILRECVDPASGFTTGDIAMGLGDIPLIEFSEVTVSEALTRITQATTATLYGAGAFWRIRPDKAVDVGVQWADAPLSLRTSGLLPTCYEDMTHERDGAQVRNEITILAGGAKVALPVFAGATEVPVTNGQLYNPAGGVVRCSGIDITFAGVRPGGLEGVFFGCTGITRDLAVGDEVQPLVTQIDSASQALVAAALGAGQSGRVVVSRENRQLSWSEAQGAAVSELAQYATPTLTFTYGLTTPGARLVDVGKLVDAYLELPGIDPAHPADVIDGLYRVQEVSITSITSPALLGVDPRLRVVLSASPARARSWYDLVKQEPDRKAH